MAEDEWERDPGVLFMRRAFAAIEMHQGELLARLNIHWMDGGLRLARKIALDRFERIWSVAAGQGLRLEEHDAADLYVHCLAAALAARGIQVPAESLPGTDVVKRLVREAQ